MSCIRPEPVTQRDSGQSMFAAGWLRLGTDRARSGPETRRERSWTAPCCDLPGHGASSSPWAIALPRAMAFRAGLPRRPPGLRGLVVPGPPTGISPASQSSSIRQRRRSFGRAFEQGSTRTASRLAGQWPTELRILGRRRWRSSRRRSRRRAPTPAIGSQSLSSLGACEAALRYVTGLAA